MNKDLNMKATRFITENADIRGQPNLTVARFCLWVNSDLLSNETESGFPKDFRKWKHELGFEVVLKKKGTFVDGHE